MYYCCCWYHKGTNFQANHNQLSIYCHDQRVVADTTKVRIFKQITTTLSDEDNSSVLLLIPQRYEFSSKSQHLIHFLTLVLSCCWYHKGTNFQANHNLLQIQMLVLMLLLIPQRYEFSSKSQLFLRMLIRKFGCCWYHKGTNFQANHNKRNF